MPLMRVYKVFLSSDLKTLVEGALFVSKSRLFLETGTSILFAAFTAMQNATDK